MPTFLRADLDILCQVVQNACAIVLTGLEALKRSAAGTGVGHGLTAVRDRAGVDGQLHPLAAAYRVSLRAVVEELLSEDRLALGALLERCRVRRLAGSELAASRSLTNLNESGTNERALRLPAPEVRVDGSPVRAWTLGEVLGGRTMVTLNDEPVEPDPELPLLAGDVVSS
jgi:hypothetical protein